MIEIKKISVEEIDDFWKLHWEHMINDVFGVVRGVGDREYYRGPVYRGAIREEMLLEKDEHHIVYFFENEKKVGASHFTIYRDAFGKCYILDFWIFPEFRNQGTGSRCFEKFLEHTKADGAQYYTVNVKTEAYRQFWLRQGFENDGKDEFDVPLMVRRAWQDNPSS